MTTASILRVGFFTFVSLPQVRTTRIDAMLLRDFDLPGPLDIRAGEELVLELPENPTTGYRWSLQVSGSALRELPAATYTASGTGIGAGGHRTFRFIAAQPGTASIHATLSRSWEPDQALQDHVLTVRIGADADGHDQ
jgi:inhibitor of cysteine peptidase